LIKVAGWTAIALSAVILLVFGTLRLRDMGQNPPGADEFGVRYVQHPRVAILHIVPGLLFLSLAPLQFVPLIRRRRITVHRRLGWLLVASAVTSGVFALIAGFRLPAYGGATTQSAAVVFGAIFLFSVTKAVRHIRRREIAHHREWMIRAFALATGVATVRVVVGLLVVLGGYRFVEAFGPSFWVGFSVNLLVAEAWIRKTRSRMPSTRAWQGTTAETGDVRTR
jgi:uncharacterized membrane protein